MHILLSGGEQIFKSFSRSIESSREILGVAPNHQVLPVTEQQGVHLRAKTLSGREAVDEPGVDAVMEEGEVIQSLYLKPVAEVNTEALKAIYGADVLCVGPGSLYTSVLPNFLVKNIKEAIQRSNAPIFLIMNILNEGLGMNNLSGKDIVKFSEEYIGKPVDKILLNHSQPKGVNWAAYEVEHKKLSETWSLNDDIRSVTAPLWTSPEFARHDSQRLATLVYNEAVRWHRDR